MTYQLNEKEPFRPLHGEEDFCPMRMHELLGRASNSARNSRGVYLYWEP